MPLAELKDVALIFGYVASILGLFLSFYAIDAWRREHAGKRRIELAEETLALFYEAVDVIREVRSPGSLGSETEDIQREDGETTADFEARRNASIVFVRLNRNRELFSRLHAMRYRFMAQVGKPQSAPFDELREIVSRVALAARMLARLWPRTHFRTDEQEVAHRERVNEYEAVFWEGLADDDPINKKLDGIIERIEATCREVIAGKGTVYGLLNTKVFGK